MTQEAFDDMVYDYYHQNTDYDIWNEKDAVNLIADFAEHASRFIVNFIEGGWLDNDDADTVYTLTPKGLAYIESLRNQKIMRHDDLMEKFHNFTINFEEYTELLELKKELDK